uniref:PH_15 domain-containing protein n=1 Tax=Elaeophora elaphi TaxID=1147741 RepID=A0A0R3RW19_9BILA
MRLFRRSDEYITLPDQEALFALPSVLYGNIEKRSLTALGWRWKKRTVVLNLSGHLIIYKHFLEGFGAGEPHVGRIIHLDAAQHIQARMDKDVCYIKIHDSTRRKTELRIKGTKARLWAAKVFIRSTAAEIEWPIERPLKRPLKILDSKISMSSTGDTSGTTKVNHVKEFSRLTIASLSAESFPDYTSSVVSYQQPAQIFDVGRIRISEVLTACGAKSEANNVEKISVQNTGVIDGKYTYKKFETNGLFKRSKSASEFTITAEFFTVKKASKSVSLSQLNEVFASRQDRFRKHLQNIIENRFYDSLAKRSSNCSVSSIQKLHAQAGSFRMSQIYIPYDTLLIKDEMRTQHQQLPEPLSLSPLLADDNCKLWEELEHGDKNENDTDYLYVKFKTILMKPIVKWIAKQIPREDGDRFFLIMQDRCQAVMKDSPPDNDL